MNVAKNNSDFQPARMRVEKGGQGGRSPDHTLNVSARRKYLTEFGVHAHCRFAAMLQQDQLSSLPPHFPDFHIYLIGRRPRVLLDEHVIFQGADVSGRFAVLRGESKEYHDYTVPNNLCRTDITLHCPYPFTRYWFEDKDGHGIGTEGLTALLVSQFRGVDASLFDVEVLYVGQAFGKDGSRSSPDRLASHSTLQQIYLHAMQNAPDHEIWILVCDFEFSLVQCTDPNASRENRTVEEEDQHIAETIKGYPLTPQQETCIAEAALIRHFQPAYNTQFRDLFPSPTHTSYAVCYDLDLNLISVEIGTDVLRCRIWSQSAPAQWTHFGWFPLASPEERRHMFDLAGIGLITPGATFDL